MLRTLSIRDIVLIDRLDLTFHPSLGVLTGETGAGKSILLDALGLALGTRADGGLIRHGATQAAVTAVFDLEDAHPAMALLDEHGIEADEGGLILRRTLGSDGRSRAFVNDQPVSVALLRGLGETLVEIHGQFENQRLLNEANHRALLDGHGGLQRQVGHSADTYRAWHQAEALHDQAAAALEAARRDEDYLRHAVEELTVLDPQPGEETSLAQQRTLMMHGETLLQALAEASAVLAEGRGIEESLRAALGILEKVRKHAGDRFDGIIGALERAALEATESIAELERVGGGMEINPQGLEQAEERLFALRAQGRKHNVETDALAALLVSLSAKLAAVEDGGAALVRLKEAALAARQAFIKAAAALHKGRTEAARRLDRAVQVELEPLKLGHAKFSTQLTALDEGTWGEHGCDRVAFQVVTNPGSPPGSLSRISSGGELARFSLALKVVLAGADSVRTLIFDEVDSGVGGAVAAAVGERLARLAEDFQILVVTHSPQVAARGAHHWLVSKSDPKPDVLTTVDFLPAAARKEEIARMLAGARVTDEARAAADSLLQGAEG